MSLKENNWGSGVARPVIRYPGCNSVSRGLIFFAQHYVVNMAKDGSEAIDWLINNHIRYDNPHEDPAQKRRVLDPLVKLFGHGIADSIIDQNGHRAPSDRLYAVKGMGAPEL